MRTDSALQQDVTKKISRDPAIDPSSIAVHVKDGVVTLSGRLRSYSEKCAIGEILQNVPGAKGLMIQLNVDLPDPSKRSDTEIAKAAEHNLRWTNFLPKDQIKVVVRNGNITLSGTVDWEYQRLAAKRVVRDLYGVTGVDNEIRTLQKLRSLDVRAMVEAEELTIDRRAFSSPQCVDYPDVVGVDR